MNKTINQLDEKTTLANNDEIILYDISESDTKKASARNVFNSRVADATRTITAKCTTALGTDKAININGVVLSDGLTIEVLFSNGHYVADPSDAMTLNVNSLGAKKIYSVKDGTPVVMPNHSCTRSESGDSTAHYWVIQANTFLKLMYDVSLDSNNGGWLVLGNPVVLSSSSANESYSIYADGWIRQKIRVPARTSGSFASTWVDLLIPYSDTNYYSFILSNGVTESADDYEAYAGIIRTLPSGHSVYKDINGFAIRLGTTSYMDYRECLCEGY